MEQSIYEKKKREGLKKVGKKENKGIYDAILKQFDHRSIIYLYNNLYEL